MTNIAFLFGVREFTQNDFGDRVETIEHAASNVKALSALLGDDSILGAEIVAPSNPTSDDMFSVLKRVRETRSRYNVSILYVCTHGTVVNGLFHILGSNVKKGLEDESSLEFAKNS